MICSDRRIYKMLLDNEKDIQYCVHQTKLRLNRLENELNENRKIRVKFEERVKKIGQ
jgi:hypothetical protein